MKSWYWVLIGVLLFLPAQANPPERSLADEDIRGPLGLPPVPDRPWEVPGQKVDSIVTRIRQSLNQKAWVPNPHGVLWGKSVYLSAGHGWYWTGTRWTTQRGLSEGIIEDHANAESIDQFVIPCLMAAGAHVIPMREADTTTHMVVVDNDDGQEMTARGRYQELGPTALFSTSAQDGFGYQAGTIPSGTNPFAAGTNRLMETSPTETARALYTFSVPADGYYNVYVSHSAWTSRAPDAHVIVMHPGGESHFRVNQRHHGRTWVLLGRFWFRRGFSSTEGAVALANDSAHAGSDVHVSLDAVRIGGGMGFIDRGQGASGKPRYEECCRYHAQYMGAPPTVYDAAAGDNQDDITCRSRLAAWVNEQGEDSVFVSWHSNAGGGRGTETYVYGPNPPDGTYNFTGTPGSDRLARHVQDRLVNLFRTHYQSDWRDRGVRSAYFGEINPSYNNEMPSALLEIVFHDSAADMVFYREPLVRMQSGRAVCHAVIQYFAERDGRPLVLPPEPPLGLRLRNVAPGEVEASWSPPIPDAAGGSPPTGYRVYVGPVAMAFDDGQYVEGTSARISGLVPGEVLFVKVHAVNDAGESMIGTPPAAVGVSATGRANILILDSFNRLSAQMNWMEDLGLSGPVHRVLMQRITDFREGIKHHAPELGSLKMAFDTWQVEGLAEQAPDWGQYELIDLILGRGASPFDPGLWDELHAAVLGGTHLFVTGSRVARQLSEEGRTDLMQQLLGVSSFSPVTGTGIQFVTDGLFDGIDPSDTRWMDGHSHDATEMETYQLLDSVPLVSGSGGSTLGVHHSTSGGEVFTFGFAFENIHDTPVRQEIMARLLEHLVIDAPVPDAGPDVDPDPDVDQPDPDPDPDPCGPEKHCTTEKVVGCHCRSGHSDSPSGPVWFLLVLGMGMVGRRRFLFRRT